jgi:hypothetical protein
MGGLLAAFGFGGIVFALIQSVPIAGVVGAMALLGLVYWEAHAPSPMVPPQVCGTARASEQGLADVIHVAAALRAGGAITHGTHLLDG